MHSIVKSYLQDTHIVQYIIAFENHPHQLLLVKCLMLMTQKI